MKPTIASSALPFCQQWPNAGPFGDEMGQKMEGKPDDTDTAGIHVPQEVGRATRH